MTDIAPPPYTYIVIFDGVTVPEFKARINQLSEVENWYTVLPQTVFIVSSVPAKMLSQVLKKRVKGLGRLLVIDANNPGDRAGWLPPAAWDFLRHPRPAGD